MSEGIIKRAGSLKCKNFNMFNWLLVSLKLRLLSSRYYCLGQFFTEEKYFSFQCCRSEKLVSLTDRMRKNGNFFCVWLARNACNLQVRSKNLCEKLQTKRRVGRWAYNLIGNGNLRYLFVKSSHCDRERVNWANWKLKLVTMKVGNWPGIRSTPPTVTD